MQQIHNYPELHYEVSNIKHVLFMIMVFKQNDYQVNVTFSRFSVPIEYLDSYVSPDIGIIELKKAVNFVSNLVGPICMPPSSRFKDRPRNAFVGGWGANYAYCSTNKDGPNPHTQCKFPFKYKGQVFSQCTRLPTPTSDNPICKQLYAWSSKHLMDRDVKKHMNEGKSVQVYYWDENRKKAATTACYRYVKEGYEIKAFKDLQGINRLRRI